MNILIDNTGLHNVSKALGNDEKYLDDLINFSSLFVFFDEFHLSGLECSEVHKINLKVLNNLKNHGIDNKIIKVDTFNQTFFKEACKETARYCVKDLDYIDFSNNIDFNVLKTIPKKTSILEENKFVLDLINSKEDVDKYKKIAETTILERLSKVVYYMVLTSSELREKLRSFSFDELEQKIDYLNLYFRTNLNISIAKLREQIYAPCLERNKLIKSSINYLSDNILEISRSRFEKSLPFPSLKKMLIQKSNKSPEKIIEIALTLRQKTSDLRKIISSNKSIEFNDEIRSNIIEHLNKFKDEFKLKLTEEEYSLHLYVQPYYKILLNQLLQWIELNKNEKRFMISKR